MKPKFEIFGGLGNQIHQYAAALYFEKKYGVKFIFSIDFIGSFKSIHNGYELENVFNLNVNVNSSPYFFRLLKIFFVKFLYFLAQKKIFSPFILTDHNRITNISSHHKLFYGYWHSKNILVDIRNELKGKLKFSLPINAKLSMYSQLVSKPNAVSIHVRKSDYLNSEHDICDIDYYINAIDIIKKKIGSPIFYIFTDDESWVLDNLCEVIPNTTVVNAFKDSQSYLDMYLMSKSKNLIIPNSTFSFWSAYLSQDLEKLIYPKRWNLSEVLSTIDCEKYRV